MKKILILISSVLALSALARADPSAPQKIPVCGALVAYEYMDEVKAPSKSDKYKHCSISCVMALYCGPIDSLEVGILKEVRDAMGFGDPDIEDLKADLRGIKMGVKLGPFQERKECYQACGALFP